MKANIGTPKIEFSHNNSILSSIRSESLIVKIGNFVAKTKTRNSLHGKWAFSDFFGCLEKAFMSVLVVCDKIFQGKDQCCVFLFEGDKNACFWGHSVNYDLKFLRNAPLNRCFANFCHVYFETKF